MKRYAITVDKEPRIKKDPNDRALEVWDPRNILALLLLAIEVSLRVVEIVEELRGSRV